MKIAYLIGQYPAINHGYLLREIELLGGCGVDVSTVSIRPPDRPHADLSEAERIAAGKTFYVLQQPLLRIVGRPPGSCSSADLSVIFAGSPRP